MSMEESISLEETNKIRISLGLKPLTDDKAPTNEKEKTAEDNYAQEREKAAKAKAAKDVQDRIAKVRNKRELNAKLKGSTLGDADDGTDDTLKWIKRSKKKEKELAKKRQEELEDMDKLFQGEEYTEKDLAGLKVSHDFEELAEGEDRILTLKDSRILDDEEDELQNVNMAENERIEKNKELKIKRRDYTGYDDEEFVDGNQGMKRAVLAKYDEFLEGPKQTEFRLGSSSAFEKKPSAKVDNDSSTSVKKSLLSIDYDKNLETVDYLKPGDIGFKKPKTKKKRPTRRAVEADPDEMDVDAKPIVPIQRNLDSNFVDDDDLQAALARSRRAKLQKPKKLSPEEVARRIAEEREQAMAVDRAEVIKIEDDDSPDGGEGGLTFDDTSEFVRAITYDPIAVKKEPAEVHATARTSKQPSEPRDIQMNADEDETMEELEAGEVAVKEEEDEEAMLNAIENAIKEAEAADAATQNDDVEVGTASEQTFGSGMAATLSILRNQGVLAPPKADAQERERVQLQRDLWLAEYRRMAAQRELDKARMRGGNKDQATREYENRMREAQEAKANLDAYKNYKPDVNIVYYDEFGRELTPKEAWKALSHKFHGKGSGRMKTEKRLKKIAEERKKEAMASGDTPLSMNSAFQIRQEKAGQAHFVLSVGNHGAVPQAAEFLDAQPLSKGKTEKKNKKKNNGQASQLDSTGFITLPAPMTNSGLASPAVGSANGSPAPRPGFSRITSTAVDVNTSNGGTPVLVDRTKVVIGLGKRKAADEGSGTPPPKRR
ncbi:SART-1 protein [Cristinia sonorae]|uniref:SART-1 protein n=1 Tax=Cristinia sonorae TaxID=1940300 RepID=A0A8K0UPH7_9AGAR|nr:SART-1 protein [Cristinia sonorae]